MIRLSNGLTQALLFFALVCSAQAFAQTPDLSCVPRDLIEVGYVVEGYLQPNGSLKTTVVPVIMNSNKKAFEGSTQVIRDMQLNPKGECSFKLLDRPQSPSLVVSFGTGDDQLETLNGVQLKNFTAIVCSPSKRLARNLELLCR